ncbi:hypothetical protein P154DRAFT_563490 [Amniculicola lignicola CBS 123094]|uniref:Uncharacterized protein n=1 Tax=Amniculicola lignicola CBS 123094 TaxID=1392246 RepID=A0A6A5WGX6_9PLEO|nr:hypothetical protein P154DRAFT_563490 [Amniculicola lignicola CBS 123094]
MDPSKLCSIPQSRLLLGAKPVLRIGLSNILSVLETGLDSSQGLSVPPGLDIKRGSRFAYGVPNKVAVLLCCCVLFITTTLEVKADNGGNGKELLLLGGSKNGCWRGVLRVSKSVVQLDKVARKSESNDFNDVALEPVERCVAWNFPIEILNGLNNLIACTEDEENQDYHCRHTEEVRQGVKIDVQEQGLVIRENVVVGIASKDVDELVGFVAPNKYPKFTVPGEMKVSVGEITKRLPPSKKTTLFAADTRKQKAQSWKPHLLLIKMNIEHAALSRRSRLRDVGIGHINLHCDPCKYIIFDISSESGPLREWIVIFGGGMGREGAVLIGFYWDSVRRVFPCCLVFILASIIVKRTWHAGNTHLNVLSNPLVEVEHAGVDDTFQLPRTNYDVDMRGAVGVVAREDGVKVNCPLDGPKDLLLQIFSPTTQYRISRR